MSSADLSLHLIQPFRPVTPAADHRRRERRATTFGLEHEAGEPTILETRHNDEPTQHAVAHEDGVGERIDIVA